MSEIAGYTAHKLRRGGNPAVVVTCTNANQDYAAAAPIPAGTRYVNVYSAAVVIIAFGEATSTTVGRGIAAGSCLTIPVPRNFDPGETDAQKTIHVQSPSAGATVRLCYLTS